MYNPDYVLSKPHVVVFTKCDLLGGETNGEAYRRRAREAFLARAEEYYCGLPSLSVSSGEEAAMAAGHRQ